MVLVITTFSGGGRVGDKVFRWEQAFNISQHVFLVENLFNPGTTVPALWQEKQLWILEHFWFLDRRSTIGHEWLYTLPVRCTHGCVCAGDDQHRNADRQYKSERNFIFLGMRCTLCCIQWPIDFISNPIADVVEKGIIVSQLANPICLAFSLHLFSKSLRISLTIDWCEDDFFGLDRQTMSLSIMGANYQLFPNDYQRGRARLHSTVRALGAIIGWESDFSVFVPGEDEDSETIAVDIHYALSGKLPRRWRPKPPTRS
jgi:hypothetical protein